MNDGGAGPRHFVAGLSDDAATSIGDPQHDAAVRMTSVPDVEGPDGEARQLPAASLRADRVAVSFALHLAVCAVLVSIGLSSHHAPLVETPLVVDVISAREFDEMRRPPAASLDAAADAGEAATAALSTPAHSAAVHSTPASRQDDMIRPSLMLSEQALQAPRNRPLQRQLAGLEDEEHVAQLCDLEAMEQIHLWKPSLQPDRLVDYARSDPRMEEGAFVAKGGAFRSGRQWYEISYRCELDAGRRKVVGFAFRVGDAIPRAEWTALNLPAVH
jgi:hypothetical protein